MKSLVFKTINLVIALVFYHADKVIAQKPNIILIVTDDAGYADWEFQGSTQVETLNTDKLRNDEILFSQAYVTNSVSAPSRAGMLTGRYQNRFGFEYNIVQYYAAPDHTLEDVGICPQEKTITDYLKNLGYVTQ